MRIPVCLIVALLVACSVWAAGPPMMPGWADRLVEQLGDDDFDTREAAARALDKAGGDAVPALRRGMQHKDAEIRARSLKIAKAIEARTAAFFEALGLSVERPGGRGRVEIVNNRYPKRSKGKLKDEHLRELAGFPWLVKVHLQEMNITDAGLHRLGTVSRLEHLKLDGTRITNKGIIWLSQFHLLETLDLSDTSISGNGLRDLIGLRSLTSINLSGTKIAKRDFYLVIQSFAKMRNLKTIYLQRIAFEDESLKYLILLKKPIMIDLSHNKQLTDNGVPHLVGSSSIIGLGLNGTSITDNACEFLKKMPKLELVGLSNTKVTMLGMIELRDSPSLRYISCIDLSLSKEHLEKLKRALPDRIGFHVATYSRSSK